MRVILDAATPDDVQVLIRKPTINHEGSISHRGRAVAAALPYFIICNTSKLLYQVVLDIYKLIITIITQKSMLLVYFFI